MRGALTVLAAGVVLAAGAACAPAEGDTATDAGHHEDGRAEADVAAEAEAETAACTSAAECDDGIACTQDSCLAGGVCGNRAIDELCDPGQHCSTTAGCTATACSTDAECSDGVYCNGDEICVVGTGGGCFPDAAGRDCSDGNPCTDDRCDTTLDRCVHDPIAMEGCESDGGDASASFDPAVHYSGSFRFAPAQSSACLSATYSVSVVTFDSSDAELGVSGPPCRMVQTPRPSGPDFSVTCTQGSCGTYTLSGRFSDADHFAGHWTASFFGTCGVCSGQDADVFGVRE